MQISFFKKDCVFPFNLTGSHTSSIKTPYLSQYMYSCPNFDFLLPLNISSASSSLITKNVSTTTTTITCVPNTQSRKYLQQPILPLCGIVYSKRLLRNEELFPLSLAFLKRRDRGIGRLTDGRLVAATVGKNIQKKCYKSSLLDSAPNYLLGCVIQKEIDWHMILLFYFQSTLFCTIT